MVSDLLIVTAPKPPGSRQLISPPAAVLEIAPANVLQGAVRLHGLTSSPTPDTQVRVACACAAVPPNMAGISIAKIASKIFFITVPFLVRTFCLQSRQLLPQIMAAA